MDPLALLDALAAGPVTPAALAAAHSVPEAALAPAIDALRAEGLLAPPGPVLAPGDLGAAMGPLTLAWRCRRPVTFLAETDSTNRVARAAAAAWPGPPTPGPLVVADHQTAGRGRLGRTWAAPPGQDLLFSLVLRPAIPAAEAPRAVLVWAAAMAEALGVFVKWPNDLVDAAGHKLGGVLAELELAPGPTPTIAHIVLGVGVNVNTTDFPGLPGATSLARLRGARVDRASTLAALVAAIEAAPLTAADPLAPWRARSFTLGRRVRVNGREGLATGLRDDGALLVDGAPVLTGDVELLAPEPAA